MYLLYTSVFTVGLMLWSSTIRQRADVTHESVIKFPDGFCQQTHLLNSETVPL